MENKKIIKIKLNVLLLLVILCIGIISSILLLNNQSKIEQYYIDNGHYIEHEKKEIINSYSEYLTKFDNNDEITDLLKDIVNEKFFNNKALIIFEDSSDKTDNISGHISSLKIQNNIANITIKREYKEHDYIAEPITRTYFIPIDNKDITNVSILYKYPVPISIIILIIFSLIPIIIFIIDIKKLIKERNQQKNIIIDSSKKENLTKQKIGSLIWFTFMICAIGYLSILLIMNSF